MKSPLRSIQCLAAIGALLASLAVVASLEGTYVLETDDHSSKVEESSLTIDVGEDGQYFATLTNSLGVLLYTEDIDVDGNDFDASFFLWESKGEKQITLSSRFENGELIGRASSNSVGATDFVGNAVEDTQSVDFNKLDLDEAIEDCYEQVTGKPMVNIQRITRDTDSELEQCVLKQLSSLEHISLWYRGSSKGLIPRVRMAELQTSD